MKLVIAEKPSVAMSLAAVLGATERKDGYLEGSGYLVSWCVGHLLELAQPEAYKEQYAKWRYEDLPILPENWKYEVPKDKKKQLALLCRLMKDKRVDSVVFNSCHTSSAAEKNPLTEIQEGELYLCLEHRTVRVRERIINLTSKEFDILALLIANPKRVFTYELITDLVWKEDCDFYSRKAIHNHISKLRKKLRFEPDLPNYIESVAGIGYKFEHL